MPRFAPTLAAVAGALLINGAVPSAHAAPPEGKTAPSDEAPAPVDPETRAIDERAERIEALLRGELDAPLSAPALFVLEAGDPVARAFLDFQSQPEAERPEPRQAALERLSRAWADYLALAPAERRDRLSAHAERREAAGFPKLTDAERESRSAALQLRTQQLRAFLEGEYIEGFDLGATTRMDMADPLVHLELQLAPDAKELPTPLPASASEAAWLRARIELRALQRRVLAMDAAERAVLLEHQRQTQPEPEVVDPSAAQESADAAEAARIAALEAAARAESEEQRQREKARAALLGFQTELGKVEQAWAKEAADEEADIQEFEQLRDSVNEVAQMGPLDGDPLAAADELFVPTRQLLFARAERFQDLLTDWEEGTSALPGLRSVLDEHGSAVDKDEDLKRLSKLLKERVTDLRARETKRTWPTIEAAKERLDQANQLYARLLTLVSPGLRSQHHGFHDGAVTEARREARFLRSNLDFWRVSVPRRAQGIQAELRANPVAVAKGLAQVLLALMLFTWWYRRREQTWESIASWSKQPDAGPMARLSRGFAWSLPAVGGPLSWLALAYFLLEIVAVRASIPGARMAWSLVAWVLVGIAVIRLVHAMAGRAPGGRRGDPTGPLRLRSLRLVGLTIVCIGLILSTTAQSVGRGAIYDWVISTCWFLALPLLLLLTHWWRPVIDRRLRELPNPTKLPQWAARPRRGLGAFVGALVGGVYLFFHGARRYALRRASQFETTRRVLAYLVRREVARQAAESDESAFSPISPELHQALDPAAPPKEGVERSSLDVAAEVFKRAVEFTRIEATSITAIVGEAGGGKTHFLNRVCEAVEDELTCIRLTTRYGGWKELRSELAAALELPTSASDDELRQALNRGMQVIAIDDAHHLVQPTIGGLAELDQLLSFARSVPNAISWLLVIEDPAWAYVRRGRGEGALFDHIARLPRWTEEEIGQLIRARCAEVGLEPDFSQLEVPQQATDDDLEEEERCEVGFYRILWDYVDGNPALALHWWRESIAVSGEGQVVVRLFHPPRAGELDNLPDSLYFALRAIVQLDGARPSDIRAASQLPRAEVENALRYLGARGFIETRQDRVYLRPRWFRAVTQVLWRRHLIIRSAN